MRQNNPFLVHLNINSCYKGFRIFVRIPWVGDEGLAKSQFKEPQMEAWQKRQALCGKNLC